MAGLGVVVCGTRWLGQATPRHSTMRPRRAKPFGHSQAAGAILDCELEEAVERVLPRAVEHLKKFS